MNKQNIRLGFALVGRGLWISAKAIVLGAWAAVVLVASIAIGIGRAVGEARR
jgi:hypothetical protein